MPTRTGDLLTVAEHAEVPAARSRVLYHWVDGRFLDTTLTTAHLRRVGAFTEPAEQAAHLVERVHSAAGAEAATTGGIG